MIVKYCFTLKTLFHGLRIADLVHVGETGALILTFILKHMYLEIVLIFEVRHDVPVSRENSPLSVNITEYFYLKKTFSNSY